jgi:[ribosomal protein S5]-alanine N-acetyltransferase
MTILNFQPFPNLETENFILKEMSYTDVEAVLDMRSNKTVMRFLPRPIMQNIDEAKIFIDAAINSAAQNEHLTWGVYAKTNPAEMLGTIGYYRTQAHNYRSEIGYALREKYFQKQIMSEVIIECIKYGFEVLNLHTIEAVIDPENIASEKLLLKNGFVKEGHFKENEFWQGKWLDSAVYTLHKNKFLEI